jgi:hypothetical protein
VSKYQAIRGYLGRLDDIWARLAYIPFGLVDLSQYPAECLGAVVPRHIGEHTVVWSDVPVILDEEHDIEWISEVGRGRVTAYTDGEMHGTLPAELIELAPLRVLRQKGKEAAWELVMRLEPYVLSLVLGAARRIAAEVGQPGSVLDDVAADEVTDELVTGGLVLKLVERLATTEKLLSQSLGSYLHINLRSMAETAVRRRIGDPHVGRKIRRVFAESGASSMPELLAYYRDKYPSEKVSEKRALAALSAGSLVGASALPFDETIFEESHDR